MTQDVSDTHAVKEVTHPVPVAPRLEDDPHLVVEGLEERTYLTLVVIESFASYQLFTSIISHRHHTLALVHVHTRV